MPTRRSAHPWGGKLVFIPRAELQSSALDLFARLDQRFADARPRSEKLHAIQQSQCSLDLVLRYGAEYDFAADLRPQFEAEVGRWLAEGKIVWRETVVDGIDNAVNGFRDLMAGSNTGKTLIGL